MRKKFLSKEQVIAAQGKTLSNMAAARYLHVSYQHYKRYAKMYKLFDDHKNQSGKGIPKAASVRMNGKYGLNEILDGKYPGYNHTYLKRRIIRSGIIEEKCCSCGLEERRVTDYTVPLLLDWIDGDKTNHKRDNLRLVCFNCYYYEVGNPFGGKMKIDY